MQLDSQKTPLRTVHSMPVHLGGSLGVHPGCVYGLNAGNSVLPESWPISKRELLNRTWLFFFALALHTFSDFIVIFTPLFFGDRMTL